ncbi:WD40 repeat-like protein [Gigaspora margarita]|uniref:ASTRA-associated protein 1 n=1 Tax=Gigaspora margarita TaxID=4874 RepID=A0A8H4AUH9_GIGMA|nr:WD40 repeat-like protein [Gigaspora margarita]
MSKKKVSSETPPSPIYIFRGHAEQINSLEFIENNRYLISGDAEGNIIIWDMISKRSKIQFKAHNDGILNVVKCKDKLISHGRDNTLHVWKFNQLSNIKDGGNKEESIKPEISLTVNSINFCKFDFCYEEISDKRDELFIAVPSTEDSSGIDIWDITNQKLIVSSIGLDQNSKTGYCMGIKIFSNNTFQNLQSIPKNYFILAAYESGSVILWSIIINTNELMSNEKKNNVAVEKLWDRKEHGESVLSIDLSSDKQFAISTSGDNKIVKYNFDEEFRKEPLIKSTTIKYAGIAEVKIRSDGKIFATAGWDTKIRIFSSKSMKPLAILSYHRESVYALAFSRIESMDEQDHDKSTEEGKDLGNEERTEKHYLVGGGKDQRISLWEIY